MGSEKKILKALTVGNSFSLDANAFREQLNAADPEYTLKVTEAYIGGCSLEKHITLALRNEADPENPEFRQYANPQFMPEGNYGLKEMLLFEKWKHITIQQVSDESDCIATFRPHASGLCSFIKKYSPDAEIILHETWADRVDNPRMKEGNKTQGLMYKNLDAAYTTIAAELGNLRIIPVGDAFQVAREYPDFKFILDEKFDFGNASYPALPTQLHALCIGWFWRRDGETGASKLVYDHHASPAGRLLAALVWRQFFFPEVDVRKNMFRPEGVSEEFAKILRQTAYSTVKNKLKPLIAE
ncbi:MAG: hypothetical protein A2020_10465 [Lentisphaerae bacterium GWF2_45_14]|nr:MAG: hypothetical protein A2020_10465 [Lentisphaerae bacterium GWF2_45_14]